MNHSKLSIIAQVFTIKSDHRLNKVDYDKIIKWAISILPKGNRLKENLYAAKSMMKPLGLGYQKIDMCPNFCMLYYLENAEMTECMMSHVCGGAAIVHPQGKIGIIYSWKNGERQGILVSTSENMDWEWPPSILVTRNLNWSLKIG